VVAKEALESQEYAKMNEAAFLAQIQEHPEDLDTLLVYSDWLEEDNRLDEANFLRAQHRVATMKVGQRGLQTRQRELLRIGRRLPQKTLAQFQLCDLTNTAWQGTSSNNAPYVFRYLPDGVLNYTSETGTYQNGTWQQIGLHIAMEMNRHYADYCGLIVGERIIGQARNITGKEWTWEARRTDDPTICDPGNPITTVFSHSLKNRRRMTDVGYQFPRSHSTAAIDDESLPSDVS
jgi:uncharacterized protein (TIGR02996 family)